jgi:hypothetical protein
LDEYPTQVLGCKHQSHSKGPRILAGKGLFPLRACPIWALTGVDKPIMLFILHAACFNHLTEIPLHKGMPFLPAVTIRENCLIVALKWQ